MATQLPTLTTPIDDDTMQHIEDSDLFNAIRNHRIVCVTWNQLTHEEQRQIYVATFDPCGAYYY